MGVSDIFFSHIVAAARNHSIGYRGQLPWHLPEDLRHFASKTKGHIIIMGRKTWESFSGLLPQRLHIVVTRQKQYQAFANKPQPNTSDKVLRTTPLQGTPPQGPPPQGAQNLVRICGSLNDATTLARQIVSTRAAGRHGAPDASQLFSSPPVSASASSSSQIAGSWKPEVFIIGGAQIYKQSLGLVRRVYLTRIDKNFKGDAFYPQLDARVFKLVNSSPRSTPIPFSFEVYERN